MIELLKTLTRIESISGNEAKLVLQFSEWIEKQFGIAPHVDDRNIILDIKGSEYQEGKGTTLLLCSHIDTVSPSAAWTKDPFGAEQVGEDIFGLGTNDALASVVSMTFGALNSFKQIKSGRLLLSFVCEEEKGSKGFVAIEPKLPRYDFAIFGEPTSLRIGYCMRGSMKLKMISSGKACHASRPHEGKNAIFQLADDLKKLESISLKDSSPWGQATAEPTIISGGTSENQIPDRVETLIDSRTTPEKNNEEILRLLSEAGINYGVIRNIRRPMFCDPDSPLVKAIQKSVPETVLYPFGGSCDMAFSTAPSVVFGPGASERSHAADEFIKVSELEAGAKAYEKIIREMLGA